MSIKQILKIAAVVVGTIVVAKKVPVLKDMI